MTPSPLHERILVLAPTGRDSSMIAQFLNQSGLLAEVVGDGDELCQRWEEGAGAAFIAEEALTPKPLSRVVAAIERQPVWSDFPIIVMTTGGKATRSTTTIAQALQLRGNVTLLERPLRILTLVSAMQAALRARRRQYEARKFLEETERGLQQRDLFLAMLGHELRNPLVPIRNGLQLLRLRPEDGQTVEQVREMMDRQVTHMVRIIDDLLDVSRITRGKVALHLEPLELRQVVGRAVEDRRSRFVSAGLSVEVELPPTPMWVTADLTRLTQVIDNLLENAGKFTDKGGRIDVRLTAEDQQAFLSIRDTGVGIDAEMKDRLFEIFAQGDRSLDRSKGGLGLGLAVVKGLVELHGGRIGVASDGPGKGAEFTISLPIMAEPPDRVLEPSCPPAAPAAPESAQKQLHILVAEDERDSADSLRSLLQLFGHKVTLAHSGLEAVKAASEVKPDVVLCDIGLPGMDGFAVAKALRRDPQTAKTRLIAVTGYGQEADRRKALEAGFDEHLIKPVDPQKLLGKLDHWG